MAGHLPGGLGSGASSRPGAIPILNGAPAYADLPVDEGTGEPTGLLFHDTTDDVVKVAMPDGAGGVATGTVVDLSASVSLGTGDGTGLL